MYLAFAFYMPKTAKEHIKGYRDGITNEKCEEIINRAEEISG